ncbi:hypothetical protein [Phosphitispora fastidiosa]|uniref:hypothetical protein n=1 Tax=Phosphitispora fastidiosa TaxID=2837202 RepID=UPI001E3178C2|nr:hypothetical protein [Phosphitispora fastidiosa]MBU7007732.1 hypothetical protein [Phosphitispora fastidiosa]
MKRRTRRREEPGEEKKMTVHKENYGRVGRLQRKDWSALCCFYIEGLNFSGGKTVREW